MGRLITVLIVCIFSSGCVNHRPVYSEHNLDDRASFLGGGYRISELEPGICKISVQTKASTTESSKTARKMWRDQAVKVHGSVNYIETDTSEYVNVRDNSIIMWSDD